MTKEKYYRFIENCQYRFENDLRTFRYADLQGSRVVLEDMFRVQPFHHKIKEKYQLDKVAGQGKDIERVQWMLDWLTAHTYYNGAQWRLTKDNPVNILRHSYKKGFWGGINCRYKAYAYADCLLSVGIKALPICLVRANIFNGKPSLGSHFMVHVYSKEMEKWVVVDPSFGTTFEDTQGRMLGYFELIECSKTSAYTAKGYNLNGSTTRCYDRYISDFVEGSIEHIGVWENNLRDKRTIRVNEMFYLISPEGKDLNAELKTKKPMKYTKIGFSELLQIPQD